MDFFTAIPEAQAIVFSKGVYRQTALFARGGKIYAKHGSGFVRLMQGGGSSHPNLRWYEVHVPEEAGTWREHQGYVDYFPALTAAA